MPGFNDPYFVYNFMSVVVHDLPLNSNWNLVCVNVMLDESGPATVFSEIIDDNNLVYVTGFGSGGATFFDPSGPGFLNTLTSIDPGMGYWVKVNSDDMLSTVGMPMADDYSMDLGSGWNLLAYWLENSMAPSDAFASLIADGNLVYVTGFGENGATFFDPSGPGFLNTLTALESGMGYWVKVNNAVSGFQYPFYNANSGDRPFVYFPSAVLRSSGLNISSSSGS